MSKDVFKSTHRQAFAKYQSYNKKGASKKLANRITRRKVNTFDFDKFEFLDDENGNEFDLDEDNQRFNDYCGSEQDDSDTYSDRIQYEDAMKELTNALIDLPTKGD